MIEKLLLIACLNFAVFSLESKVRILTFHCNEPDFIELQFKTLSRFLEDDFELLVFNDAKTEILEQKIQSKCEELGVQCIRFDQQLHIDNPINDRIMSLIHNPKISSQLTFYNFPHSSISDIIENRSVLHSHVIQYALDNYGYNHDDIVVIMDGDAFFIRKLNLHRLLEKDQVVGIRRTIAEDDVDYLWVIFIAFNPRDLPNVRDLKFGISDIKRRIHDTGSESVEYFKNNPSVKVKKISGCRTFRLRGKTPKELKRLGFLNDEIWLIKNLPKSSYVEFHMRNHILHFGASSFGIKDHELKSKLVNHFLNRILN